MTVRSKIALTACCNGPMVDAQQGATAVFLKLSPREQELLQMIAWEGLSIDEVAEILECSKTAVAIRLVRGRRRLAALMRASGLATNDDDATVPQLWTMRTAAPKRTE